MKASFAQRRRNAGNAAAKAKDTWVKPYLARYKKTLFLSLFLGCLTIFFAAGLMFTSGWLIGGSAQMPYSILLLGTPLLLVRVFGVGKPILQYIERLTSHDWVLRMTSDLRVKLYCAFNKEGMFFHAKHRLGDALGLLAEDIGHIQNLYLRTVFPTVIAWILGLALVIGFGLFSWWVGVVVLAVLVLEILVVPGLSVSINGVRQAKHKALKTAFYTDLTDNVMGITDWVLSGRRSDYLTRHQEMQKRLRALEREAHAFDRKRDFALQALFMLGAVLVLVWAATEFATGDAAGGVAAAQAGGQAAQAGAQAAANATTGATGDGSANWILAFALGYFPLLDAFGPLSGAATEGKSHSDAIERLNRLSKVDQREVEEATQRSTSKLDALFSPGTDAATPSSAGSAGSANSPSASTPSLGPFVKQSGSPINFEFSDVHFAYPNSAREILRGVNLTIKQGEKIAILGKSGAGKSTLASLLRGDLKPTSGNVLLDGVPCARLNDSMAHWVGVIQQSTYLFNTTLRENLRIGNPAATDREITQALRRVGLGALLDRLPSGLDTMVDEAGLRFSGGERHRIALARVLLQDVPVVILDEPMVGLDPVTEHQVLTTLFDVLKDKTIIMITHHLQGVGAMDRVLFLKDGQIFLDGSPKELEQTSGYYRNLLALDRG